jgi:hypothetical protein
LEEPSRNHEEPRHQKHVPNEVLKIAKKRGDYLLSTERIVERRFV